MTLAVYHHKAHHPIRWTILVIFILSLVAGSWFGYRWYVSGELPPIPFPLASADTQVDESVVTPLQVSQYTVPQANPRYITMPTIDVGNTRVYPVTMSANNVLASSSDVSDAGWYSKSSTPGDGGVVLINGHYKGNSRDGTFAKLAELKIGDIVSVERGDGKKFSYVVHDTQTMTRDDFNTKGVKLAGTSAQTGTEGLNLVTDSGKWIPRFNMFDHAVVVRAVIE